MYLAGEIAHISSIMTHELWAFLPLAGKIGYAWAATGPINLAVLLLPVTRTSPWVVLLGIPFERAVKYHRWLGRWAYLGITVHGMSMWSFWGTNRILSLA